MWFGQAKEHDLAGRILDTPVPDHHNDRNDFVLVCHHHNVSNIKLHFAWMSDIVSNFLSFHFSSLLTGTYFHLEFVYPSTSASLLTGRYSHLEFVYPSTSTLCWLGDNLTHQSSYLSSLFTLLFIVLSVINCVHFKVTRISCYICVCVCVIVCIWALPRLF